MQPPGRTECASPSLKPLARKNCRRQTLRITRSWRPREDMLQLDPRIDLDPKDLELSGHQLLNAMLVVTSSGRTRGAATFRRGGRMEGTVMASSSSKTFTIADRGRVSWWFFGGLGADLLQKQRVQGSKQKCLMMAGKAGKRKRLGEKTMTYDKLLVTSVRKHPHLFTSSVKKMFVLKVSEPELISPSETTRNTHSSPKVVGVDYGFRMFSDNSSTPHSDERQITCSSWLCHLLSQNELPATWNPKHPISTNVVKPVINPRVGMVHTLCYTTHFCWSWERLIEFCASYTTFQFPIFRAGVVPNEAHFRLMWMWNSPGVPASDQRSCHNLQRWWFVGLEDVELTHP